MDAGTDGSVDSGLDARTDVGVDARTCIMDISDYPAGAPCIEGTAPCPPSCPEASFSSICNFGRCAALPR